MKKDINRLYIALFVIVALFLAFSCNAQGYRPRAAPLALSFVSGAAWGIHEKTAHNWPQFQAKFSGANPGFWNPAISWRNKYRNGQPDQGRNNVPIWTTDAAHLTATTNQVLIFGAGAAIAIGQKRKWWHYAADAGISFAAYTIGNHITYDLMYRK